MTLRDNGRSSLSLYGPENTSDFVKATRFFLHQEKLHFDCVDFSESEEHKYEDENVTIWPMVLTGTFRIARLLWDYLFLSTLRPGFEF